MEAHVPGSTNIPLADLSGRGGDIAEIAGTRRIAILCRTGKRAERARRALDGQGLTDSGVMQGGIVNWMSKDLPVNRGPKAFSIERQVRTTAGLLVFAGVLLGLAIHPGFFGLSGFVGLGLAFAGITDTCGMALLFAKMPWNRVVACGKAS